MTEIMNKFFNMLVRFSNGKLLDTAISSDDVYKLMWLFVIGSIMGYVIETIWYYMLRGHYVNRQGVIYGPFSPIYGVGMAGFVILLYRYRKLPSPLMFIIAGCTGGAFEYIAGWLQEKILGTKSWDYSKKPFNIHGRICLEFAMYWGIIGVTVIKVVYPLFSMFLNHFPLLFNKKMAVLVFGLLVADCIFSILVVIRQKSRRNGEEAKNAIERFFDRHYTDERLDEIFTEIRIIDSKSNIKEANNAIGN